MYVVYSLFWSRNWHLKSSARALEEKATRSLALRVCGSPVSRPRPRERRMSSRGNKLINANWTYSMYKLIKYTQNRAYLLQFRFVKVIKSDFWGWGLSVWPLSSTSRWAANLGETASEWPRGAEVAVAGPP